jgi:hypothetical protein
LHHRNPIDPLVDGDLTADLKSLAQKARDSVVQLDDIQAVSLKATSDSAPDPAPSHGSRSIRSSVCSEASSLRQSLDLGVSFRS